MVRMLSCPIRFAPAVFSDCGQMKNSLSPTNSGFRFQIQNEKAFQQVFSTPAAYSNLPE